MANSPYSFRGIKTYNNNYVWIEQIPGFTEEKAFSVECQLYPMNTNDGIIVSHADSLCLYMEEEFIWYRQDSKCPPVKIMPVVTGTFMNLTVTYDLQIWTFYLNGYKILQHSIKSIDNTEKSQVIKKSGSQSENTTGFTIGEKIKGYFSFVRFYKECLTEQKVLSYAVGTPPVTSLYAWIDFTEAQIIDKGPAKIEVCAKGLSCLYTLTPALFLNGKNYAYIDEKQPEKNTNTPVYSYTCMGKINPAYCANETMTIFANNSLGSDKGIKIDLVHDKDQTNVYHIIVTAGRTEFKGEGEMMLNEWSDFAITVTNNQLKIYTNDKEKAFSLATPIDVGMEEGKVFGVSIDQELVADYETAMEGYISYIAEFDIALSAEEVMKYKINLPYFFDKHLTSNYIFYEEDAINLLNCQSIGFHGKGGGLALAEDARAGIMPTTLSIYIPDSDPKWDTYTKDEKWQIEFMARLLEESYSTLFVGSLNSYNTNVAWYLRIASFLNQLRRRAGYTRMMDTTPHITTQSFMQWLRGLTQGWYRTLIATMTRAATMDTQTKVITGLAVTTVTLATFTQICRSIGSKADQDIDKNSDDRPDPPPTPTPTPTPTEKDVQLRLVSVQYDLNSDGETGAIHIKKDINTPMEFPEWQSSKNSEQVPALAAIVRNDIKKMIMSVTVKAYLSNVTSASTLIYVSLTHPATGKQISLQSSAFSIKNNETKTINFELPFSKEDFNTSPAKYNICMYWKYYQEIKKCRENMGRTFTSLYVLNNKPTRPLVCEYKTAYDATKEYPSIRGMDLCQKIYEHGEKIKDTNYLPPIAMGIAAAITIGFNDSIHNNTIPDYVYDVVNGASLYIIPNPLLALHMMLDIPTLLTDSTVLGQQYTINCMDCAFIIQYLCGLQGVPLTVTKMTSSFNFIETNPIIPIGFAGWGVPFNGGFSFHAVAVDYDPTVATFYSMRLYDACLSLDFGPTPSTNVGAIPQVPIDIAFSYTYDPFINITEPYAGIFYRERLVVNQTPCELFFGALNAVQEEERFHKITDERLGVSKALQEINYKEVSTANQIEITFPKEVNGRYYICKNTNALRMVLTQLLSLISSPELSRNKEVGIGDICYTNKEKKGLIIFTKNNYVISMRRISEKFDLFRYAKQLEETLNV
ncbi:hypothetical protein [Parabacteroides faecis]|uniref:LamG domain-containing protein n=1 Tax=Parabacteroides faecis TaxID=1217282 RepID=A0ABR6KJA7_9BACT|nr:hypothetical protein [Parabacteroides faecis]MBB4620997.1 hypothetical protein [Parabacteroides faecis]GGJ89936.1 hypothetical protein GCM10007084_12090 [Parabacteroides faecis]